MVMRTHPTRRGRLRLHTSPSRISMPGLVTASFLDQIASIQPLPERPFDLPTQTVHVNGADLHYFEFGQGEPVVFVHGSIGDYRTWSAQFEPFSARYRVISYSRRYHYPNAWVGDGTDYTTRTHAEDLSALIERLDLGPVHLIGQSSGGSMAALCARRFPECIRTLVLNEADIIPLLLDMEGGQQEFEALVDQIEKPAGAALASGDYDGCIRAYVDGVLGKGTYGDLSLEVRTVMLDNIPELRAEMLSAHHFYSPFNDDDARQIQAPTLLVEGGRSLPTYLRISAKLHSLIPRSEQARIPEAPHAAHFRAPDAFNAVVLEFLRRNEGGAAKGVRS